METNVTTTTEPQHDAKLSVSGSAFDFEDNFIVCQCQKPKEIYDKHLGDGGYDWCKKCDCPLGDS